MSRQSLTEIGLVLTALFLCACGTETQQDDWEQAQVELGQRFMTAVANKDVDGVMECFWHSPEVVLVLENGTVVRGWQDIRAGVQGMIDAHAQLSLVVNEVSRFRLGDEVHSVGTATWTRTLKEELGGGTTTFVERWTDVSRKVDGRWVYVVDHAHDLRPFDGS
jgi:ketosteroid isomerase-like protein